MDSSKPSVPIQFALACAALAAAPPRSDAQPVVLPRGLAGVFDWEGARQPLRPGRQRIER
jgi:hypothetical protein